MPAPEPNVFFKQSRSFTAIKEELFGKYFENWSAGCLGKLKEKNSAVALLLDMQAGEEQSGGSLPDCNNFHYLKSIIKRPALNEKLHTFFYDKSKVALEKTIEQLQSLPNYSELVHPTVPINNAESRAQLSEMLDAGISSLLFLDPFHSTYASQVLLQAVTSWQSDLFMLLRPDNLTKAVAGKKVSQAISDLFGWQLQDISNYSRKEKCKAKRQKFILEQFVSQLQKREQFTLLFKINLPEVEEPEHYLLFATPDSTAYRSFKETVLPYSTLQPDGVPTFITNEFPQPQLTLFEQLPDYSLPDLVERIKQKSANYKYKTIESIYELDSLNTNYSRDNYIAAVEQLRKAGKVELLNGKTMQPIRQPVPTAIVKYRL